jgi:hypothetical protein
LRHSAIPGGGYKMKKAKAYDLGSIQQHMVASKNAR